MSVIDNFQDSTGRWVVKTMISGKNFWTKSGSVWHNVKQRCKIEGAEQLRNPAYVGSFMSKNFKNFEFFVNWHSSQVGFGLENYHIDKDILIKGNKQYHEDCCVLVPQALNNFLCAHGAARGEWPQGVSFNKEKRYFQATITIDSKAKRLGGFNTPEAAFIVYKSAKEQEARRWAQRLEDGEFIVDLRVIERLRNWTLES